MDNEIGDYSNDDNDMEVAMVLGKGVVEADLCFDHSSSTESPPPILAWISSSDFQSLDDAAEITSSGNTSDSINDSDKSELAAEAEAAEAEAAEAEAVAIETDTEKETIIAEPTPRTLRTLAGQGDLYKIKNILSQSSPDSSYFTELKSGVALLPAARFNWVQVVNFLLENGSPINTVGEYGTTALHQACCKGHIDVVQLLLNYNPDLDIQCFDGSTALHYAVYGGNVDCVKALLRAGADLTIKNKYKMTPGDMAFELDNEEILDALQGHLLDIFL